MKIICSVALFLALISCSKTETTLNYGAVSSASPEATEAGIRILKAGGNAVDASIAVSFALGVSEPAMSGIGGGTQVQIYLPGQLEPFAINGSTLSPALTPVVFKKDSLNGHLRSTVPSTVKVMQYLFDNYGSKKIAWKNLLQPAIEIAEKGLETGPFRGKVFQRYQEKLEKGLPFTSEYLLSTNSNGKQLKMANTLKLIAQNGADIFYKGEIARSIAEDMRNNGGWISELDLEMLPQPENLGSVHFMHNGYDIYTQPEPAGGWIIKEILEKLTELRSGDKEVDEIQLLIEAIHFGHSQRELMAKEIAKENTGETTHFSVMDKEGIAVSITSSINAYYGAGVVNPDYGFFYNSYMDDFIFDEIENTYALGPNKMAYSSMSPTIVLKDGKVVLIIGSPGSSRIISTIAQLIDTYTRGEIKPEQLLELPRVHAINQKVYLENGDDRDLSEISLNTDWEIVQPSTYLIQNGLNAYFGGVHAIVWTGKEYKALADPRRDGLAITD
ncbi:MAG: gamma-glutamyltransferase family protein [Balneola sp.]